jgi:hypothetical protein
MRVMASKKHDGRHTLESFTLSRQEQKDNAGYSEESCYERHMLSPLPHSGLYGLRLKACI